MIDPAIQVFDVHPDHWANLVLGPAERAPLGAGWLVLVHQDGRVVHAVRGTRPAEEWLGQPVADLAGLRRRAGVGRVICLERECLTRCLRRADLEIRASMDWAEQAYQVWAALRAERGRGLRLDPPTPPGPLPPFAWLQAALDLLWPDDTSLVLYVVDEDLDDIWTSLLLRKRRGAVDLLTTDRTLAGAGLCAARWREDRVRLCKLIGQRLAPVWAGCFASLEGWRALWRAGGAAAARRSLQTRGELVFAPRPRRVTLAAAALEALWPMLRRLPF